MSALPKLIFSSGLRKTSSPIAGLETHEKSQTKSTDSAFFKMFTKLLSGQATHKNKKQHGLHNEQKKQAENEGKINRDSRDKNREKKKSTSLSQQVSKLANARANTGASTGASLQGQTFASQKTSDKAPKTSLSKDPARPELINNRSANVHQKLQVDVAINEYLQGLIQRLHAQSSQKITAGALLASKALSAKTPTQTRGQADHTVKSAGTPQLAEANSVAKSLQQTTQAAQTSAEGKSLQQDSGPQEQSQKAKSNVKMAKVKMETDHAQTFKAFETGTEFSKIKASPLSATQAGTELGQSILRHMQAQGWIAKAAMHQGPLQFDINDKTLGKISITLNQTGNMTRVGLIAAPFSAAQLQVASDWLRKRLKGQNEVLVTSRPQKAHNKKKEAHSWR